VDRLLDSQRYDLLLRFEQQRLEQQLRVILDEAERRQIALVEADREVRVLERLRETARQRQRRDDLQREAVRLDEAALRPFVREESL
jgi:flagellar export protein FliJ